jgi:hypothetical protein
VPRIPAVLASVCSRWQGVGEGERQGRVEAHVPPGGVPNGVSYHVEVEVI